MAALGWLMNLDFAGGWDGVGRVVKLSFTLNPVVRCDFR